MRRDIKLPSKAFFHSNIFAHLHKSKYTSPHELSCTKLIYRVSSKLNYIDVDNKSEYKDIVQKILEKKLKKVSISLEMTDVKKGCQKAQVQKDASYALAW